MCTAVSPAGFTALMSLPRASAAETASQDLAVGLDLAAVENGEAAAIGAALFVLRRRERCPCRPPPSTASRHPSSAGACRRPPAASARMMSASRNLAASRYGVAPINVFGSSKSWLLRRTGVPFVICAFGFGLVREQRLHQIQIAPQDGGVQGGVADGRGIRVCALLEQQRSPRDRDRCARRRRARWRRRAARR